MRSIALTPAEQRAPYASYFTRPPATPDPAHLARMDQPIDPAQALKPEHLDDLLEPGHHATESGWCVMPNGSGYVSNHTRMPGVTLEMINWWFAWHALEDLRYKLWWPAGHFAASIPDPVERARALEPATPLTRRIQGLTHHVVEDIGSGPEEIRISFLTPEDFGFDVKRFDPKTCTLVAANGRSRPLGAFFLRPWAPAMMCHFVRQTDDGVELRSRFWLGYQVVDRTPRRKLPPFVKVPASVPRGLAVHNVHEYTNLGSFLPALFAQQHG